MAEDIPTDDAMARAIVGAMLWRLNGALADPTAQSVTLTRDEAILTLGLVEAAAKMLERELKLEV